MSATYEKADQRVHQLIEQVRNKWHQDLRDQDARFLVLMRDPAASRRGQTVLGSVARASGKDCALLGDEVHYIVTIAKEEWQILTARQREALLDHELSHCGVDVTEDKKGNLEIRWFLVGHDIEEFSGVLKRHGAWHDGIRAVVEQLQQLNLFAEPGPPGLQDSAASSSSSENLEPRAGSDLLERVDAILQESGVTYVKNATITIGPGAGGVLKEAAGQLRARGKGK